eukprot:GILJ01002063.1.p1 GENE.GILJ01002063.1~~GILJ01002063.1.p1  ORF type:complete len:262 (+),score=38.39 GILJ01002063.1:68-853(+)
MSSFTGTRDLFLLLGDSLTQQCFENGGWGAQLCNAYNRQADILCRGFSGYNSRHLMLSLETILSSLNGAVPSLITIFIGANDAVLSSSAPQFVDVGEYKQNLLDMIRRLKKHVKDQAAMKRTHIVLITPPPIHAAQRAVSCQEKYGQYTPETDRSDENAQMYALAMKEVAQSMGVFCLNLWEQMHTEGGENYGDYLSDGLHFSASGQTFVCQSLLALIKQHIRELVPAKMSVDFPLWNDIPSDREAAIAFFREKVRYVNPY